MRESKNSLKNYRHISEDVKYAANSVIRLEILASLHKEPQNMKELAKGTKLSYSSISSNIHGLELKDFVYRKSNKYYLSNTFQILMNDILEFKEVVNFLNKVFNIIDGHVISRIPVQSVSELNLLSKATLLESGGVDAYKIYKYIKKSLVDANNVQCILPVYSKDFNERLNVLVENNRFVEALVSQKVFDIYEKRSKISFLSPFKRKNSFLLFVSDEMMILGLFKDNGYFDQNRILTSRDAGCIIWAKNLFRNFKKENII